MKVRLKHKIMFAILRPIFFIYLRVKYRFYAEKFNNKKIKKPYLILSNHTTTLDPFMVALSFKTQIYFIASDDIFSIKFISPLIKFLVAPIAKTKSSSDLQTVRDCYKIAKQGGTIGVFPEGNRTYHGETLGFSPSVVKLVRALKLPLALYNISGGYGANPRWSNSVRKGKVTGKVVKTLTEEEYDKLPDDELYKVICDKLYVNDIDGTKARKLEFKGKTRAEYLERVCYICPDCGGISTYKSEGNMFRCVNCRSSCIYEKNLTLNFIKGFKRFKTVKDWYDYQKTYLAKSEIDLGDKSKILLSDEDVLLRLNIRARKKTVVNSGKLSLFCDRLESESKNRKDVFYFNDISAITVFGKNKLQFYTKENSFQLIGQLRFCALKYYQFFYELNKGKGERNGANELMGL